MPSPTRDSHLKLQVILRTHPFRHEYKDTRESTLQAGTRLEGGVLTNGANSLRDPRRSDLVICFLISGRSEVVIVKLKDSRIPRDNGVLMEFYGNKD